MYYKEEWINGKLYWKASPNGKWIEFTKQQYAERLLKVESELKNLQLGAVMRSCIHCGNKDQSKFEVWEELDYNDGADEPHTGGNYLINVEYGTCLVCGENL